MQVQPLQQQIGGNKILLFNLLLPCFHSHTHPVHLSQHTYLYPHTLAHTHTLTHSHTHTHTHIYIYISKHTHTHQPTKKYPSTHFLLRMISLSHTFFLALPLVGVTIHDTLLTKNILRLKIAAHTYLQTYLITHFLQGSLSLSLSSFFLLILLLFCNQHCFVANLFASRQMLLLSLCSLLLHFTKTFTSTHTFVN